MRWVIAVVVVLPVVLLAAAAWRGRAQVRCCSAADPRRDLRMRAAFEQTAPEGVVPGLTARRGRPPRGRG